MKGKFEKMMVKLFNVICKIDFNKCLVKLIYLEVNNDYFVIIIGLVGSGKLILLFIIMGEILVIDGYV